MERTSLSNVIRYPTKQKVAAREIGLQPVVFESAHEESTEPMEETSSNRAEAIIAAAEQRAQMMIEEATNEAKRIKEDCELRKSQLEQECKTALAEAEQQGYEAGFSAGETQVTTIYESQLVQAQQILEDAQIEAIHTIEKHEPFIIDLATAIAERILGDVLNQETQIKHYLKSALYEVKEHQFIRVYVHPFWYDKMKDSVLELAEEVAGCKDFKVIPDTKLTENHCYLVTNAGRLDASLDTQLIQLKQQLHQLNQRSRTNYANTTN